MPERLRHAEEADLDALVALQETCYEPERRSSRASLRRSLRSPRQEAWVLDDEEGGIVALLVVWRHPRTLRVHDVSVHPDHQGRGLGGRLLRFAEAGAVWSGAERVVLEADADRPTLLGWYEGQGYRRVALRRDYYAPGRHAWRMEKRVAGPR